MPTTLTPAVESMLDFLQELLVDLAQELASQYDEVTIRVMISAE